MSISAPYRHFADRDAMLAAAALAGFRDLESRFAELPEIQAFGDWTAQIAVAYLRFAQEDPARFEVMFAGGFDKSEHDDLMRQANRIQEQLEAALEPHFTGRRSSVAGRAAELWSLAHGVATLAVEGGLGHAVSDRSFDQVAESAARAWSVGVDSCS
ncbi:TetR-like C-terminal domain-containing protein [Streptomyces sp. M10(2022)]